MRKFWLVGTLWNWDQRVQKANFLNKNAEISLSGANAPLKKGTNSQKSKTPNKFYLKTLKQLKPNLTRKRANSGDVTNEIKVSHI